MLIAHTHTLDEQIFGRTKLIDLTLLSHLWQICEVREKANWTLEREKDLTSPYIYSNDKWIGFDDEISIQLKVCLLIYLVILLS